MVSKGSPLEVINDTPIAWEKFLESTPPNTKRRIIDLTVKEKNYLSHPELLLYCDSDICKGERMFSYEGYTQSVSPGVWNEEFLEYKCRNCGTGFKIYAVSVRPDKIGVTGEAIKLGERPPFGPHTPARVISLIGPDRDLFLKGRRSESKGLGIGAFAYYRRVVENQKGQLIGEIIKVATQFGNKQVMLDKLEAAKRETQFSKAVEQIKNAIPESLLIKGHNPLTLLHTALSRGIHAKTDGECLEVATHIRVVLVELADRIGEVLKENAELDASLTRLLKDETPKKTKADKDKQENSKEQSKTIEDEAE